MADGFIKTLSGFAIFFNIACLLIQVILSNNFGDITITIPSLRNTGGIGTTFTISILTGIIVVVAAIAVSALVGAQVLSSGLNDTATGILIKLVSYLIVWMVVSGGTLTVLAGLGGSMAWMIYGMLSLFYIINIASGVSSSEAVVE